MVLEALERESPRNALRNIKGATWKQLVVLQNVAMSNWRNDNISKPNEFQFVMQFLALHLYRIPQDFKKKKKKH